MVSSSYLTEERLRPSVLKQRLDQQVIPAAIDALAGMEEAMDKVAQATRRNPALVLGGAALLALVATRALLRR